MKPGIASKEPDTRNYVHESIIREETIKKESLHLQKNRSQHYQLNPFSCKEPLKVINQESPH